jgi:hypothetical protein
VLNCSGGEAIEVRCGGEVFKRGVCGVCGGEFKFTL